jgi:hypothetical protein
MRNEVSDVAFINDLITWVRNQPNVGGPHLDRRVFQWGCWRWRSPAPEG